MANFIMKKFSDRSYNIDLSRKTVGEVRLMPSGLWMATLHGRLTVHNFHDAYNAFRAIVMQSNIEKLNQRCTEKLEFTLAKGCDSAALEVAAHSNLLYKYVDHNNKFAQAEYGTMRVVKRRR